ncbi:cytochrome P450 [Streptomyces erythrochromogenes]|uniref:bifunctional cytochrome P450/NADPH--P450 reductase n=1 Tax=Streptomyces erythrochromogenes TaxID=285574 RepID=UPI00344AAB9F
MSPHEQHPVPGPRGLPVLGNAPALARGSAIEALMGLAQKYGPIFKLALPSGDRLVVSGADLVEEICDDKRFDKDVGGGLARLRDGAVGTGLFTADTDDPLWRQAHQILLPPFGLGAMRDYLPMMLDIAGELMDKWSRLNPDDEIDVAEDMTRLTLDTIALCGFGYRFNSFYRETPHPFVEAMVRVLEEAQKRSMVPALLAPLRRRAARRFERDNASLNATVDRIIRERRAGLDSADRDLLTCMLVGADREGRTLPDVNIRHQCITFLVAGHETTSSLLSFTVALLLRHPEVARRLQAEADEILGPDPSVSPTFEQIQQLRYTGQVLDEAMRLWPPAPAFSRTPVADTLLGGRYAVARGTPITVLTPTLHRDPDAWGDDPERFDPERFGPERRRSVPPHAFKPFGTGQRACIGRQFALQEAKLVLGMVMQRFELVDHRHYELKIKQTLTIKPDGLRMRVRPRPDRTVRAPGRGLTPTPTHTHSAERTEAAGATVTAPGHGTPLTVLFGSNLGTAEQLAGQLAREGNERGYTSVVAPLDEYVKALDGTGATVLVCASYNGSPPDNAGRFCAWLDDPGTAPDACAGVRYAVFGCGHSDWASTYQAVPTLIDSSLAEHGAQRVHERGAGDAKGDFDGQYRAWRAGLWPALARTLNLPEAAGAPVAHPSRLALSMVNSRETNPVVTSYRARPAIVRVNQELQQATAAGNGHSTRHIEISLPPGTGYAAGDHLGVLPRNRTELIWRVLERFALDPGTYVTVAPGPAVPAHLPTGQSVPLVGILAHCVELQDVATRADLETLAEYASDPREQAELTAIAADGDEGRARYQEEVRAPHRSVLDLLDRFSSCHLPFEVFLDHLPPLRPRYYSISSSPLTSRETCTITTGVVAAPARSGNGTFHGVCSAHLADAHPDSTVFAFVRKAHVGFRPPEDPRTEMIMVACGTGLAPFRGFLQERAVQHGLGTPVSRSLLFYGCRHPQRDYLYQQELADYEHMGIVQVHPAFSQLPGQPKTYVQHLIAAQEDDVWERLDRGAVVLVCGNATTMAPAVRAAFTDLYARQTGSSHQQAQEWLAGLQSSNRYLEDIWGG